MLTVAKKSEDEMLADLGTELGFPHVRGLAQSRERGRGLMVQAAQRMQEKRTLERTMLVRLKPHDPKKGLVLKQYTYRSIRFQAGRGWYKVDGEIAAYLETVHSVPGDPDTPPAFDVCTSDEARAMDENDRKAARQVLPADEPLDMTHVRDEHPRVNRQRSNEHNDVPLQRRSRVQALDDEQLDALEDDVIKDEASRRRTSRPCHQAVPRQRQHADEFEDFNSLGAAEAELSLARRRVEANAFPHGHAYDLEKNAPARRSRQRIDESEERDDADEAPPPRRQHSLTGQSREKQTRYAQRYVVEHDGLGHDDGRFRRVRGAQQAEALDVLRNREARRIRRQYTLENQYKEMPARCVQEDAVERELDDEPTQKLRRSRFQADRQHELPARHARQMAARLGHMDALDDAMSHGDAEDSLPITITCKRHNSRGDAEDSLPIKITRDRHSSHGDAEDSLPGSTARARHSSHGDAEDSLPRSRQSAMHGTYTGHRDAEDSLPRCDRRMQHQDAPSLRHQRGPRAALDAVDDDFGGRNAEEPSHSDARGPRAQQPPSSAAHDELDALDDALDDRLAKASEDQRPGSAQLHARGPRAQQPPSSAAHDELDALDDALDDRLAKASEDQRPGSAQQHAGTNLQCHPQGNHASGEVSRDECLLDHDDLFVNCDARDQIPIQHQEASKREAPGSERETVVQREPKKSRRTYARMRNTHPRDHPDALAAAATGDSDEKRTRPPQRSPPEHGSQCQLALPSIDG